MRGYRELQLARAQARSRNARDKKRDSKGKDCRSQTSFKMPLGKSRQQERLYTA
jgi:hypothetical protein